jgi:hypothetical protein
MPAKKSYSSQSKARNSCDGCARKLPLRNGTHYDGEHPMQGCVKPAEDAAAAPIVMTKRTNYAGSISFSPEEYIAFRQSPPDVLRIESMTGKLLASLPGGRVAQFKAQSTFARGIDKNGDGYTFPIYVIRSILFIKAAS